MLSNLLLQEFQSSINFDPLAKLEEKKREQLPIDYFQFYNSISSVYSSKIEGEEVDFDSFFKYKFMNVEYKSDYTKKTEDLFQAYEFIQSNPINRKNIFEAHHILSKHLLPKNQRGKIRNNPMFVINDEDRIEYVACEPRILEEELVQFFRHLNRLLNQNLTVLESFFYASKLHLAFVKIHPMQEGNGRTGRLLEKWFLLEKLGRNAVAIELEKNYYTNRKDYYGNIRKLGLEYRTLDYSKSLDFLLMTISSLE